MAEPNNVSSQILLEMQRAGQDIAAVRKILLKVSQSELASQAGIGMSTMVAIEKGSTTVQLCHWLAVLEAIGLTQGLSEFANMGRHPEMLEAVRNGAPRTTRTSKRRKL